MRVGVEVGGTFTDLVAIEDGRIRTAKVPSTPSAPRQSAFATLGAWNGAIDAVVELAHAPAVATNAVLERKGAKIALWVTHGMRDVLRLQRHNRRSIYDLHYAKPAPLVERRDTFEVVERMDAAGGVVTGLDEAGVKQLAGQLDGSNYDVLAIAFLNSYANPAHERRAASLARRFGWSGPITCSHEVIPVFQYERFSTTAMAAYVQPVVSAYLERFEHQLESTGFEGNFSVGRSTGDACRRTRWGKMPSLRCFWVRPRVWLALRIKRGALGIPISSHSTWGARAPMCVSLRTAAHNWSGRPKSMTCLSKRPCSISSPLARAEFHSSGSMMVACCGLGPGRQARSLVLPATGEEERSPP